MPPSIRRRPSKYPVSPIFQGVGLSPPADDSDDAEMWVCLLYSIPSQWPWAPLLWQLSYVSSVMDWIIIVIAKFGCFLSSVQLDDQLIPVIDI